MARDESVRSEVGRIAPVEGLRGIAVIAVILFHCFVLRTKDPWIVAVVGTPIVDPLVRNGYLGVDLFFLISGFLLAMPWFKHADAGRESPSMKSFYARRFWRIAPAYYVQLVLLFVVVLPLLRGGWNYWRYDMWVYLYNVFAHLLFLHNTTPLSSASMGANGALWTLSIEAQFYVLLPLVMPLFLRWPKWTLVGSLALAQLWRIESQDGLDWLVRMELDMGSIWKWPESSIRYLLTHQLPGYLAHFALGIVLGHTWLRWHDRVRKAWWVDLTLAVSTVVLYVALVVNGNLLGRMSWTLPLAALTGLMFWAVMRPGRVAQTILGRGPLAAMGRISYSAYLYHLPLLLIANEHLTNVPEVAVIPVYLVATIGVAWLSWRLVEQPFLHGLRPLLGASARAHG